jgi:hypothetical protein
MKIILKFLIILIIIFYSATTSFISCKAGYKINTWQFWIFTIPIACIIGNWGSLFIIKYIDTIGGE